MCRECGNDGWHVELISGDDDSGDGSKSKPFRTELGAGERLQLIARLVVDPKKGLLTFMEHLSEDRFDAGWHMGLEDTLWDAWHGKPWPSIREWEAGLLRTLSTMAGGWYAWTGGVGDDQDEAEFFTFADWERWRVNPDRWRL